MNYIKVTYPVGSSFIKSTFEDNSSYIKTSVNSTFIKVSYDGGSSGLDAERLRTKVYNVTGATLTKGTVVYINGTHGNLPSVTKAIATGDATSAQTLGLVMEDILDNKSGYIIIAGKLSDLDTQAFANGSQLYLSSTVAGTYTTTKQYAPAHLVYVGIINRSHPTQGEIEVKIQNGYEADEIHDFAVRNPLNNQGIFFNSTTSLWEKKYVSDALGYTPANASTTLTINGVTFDLSQNRSWTIAAGISGSGTSGQVSYWTGASSLGGSNNLFWDATNSRLGIGTTTPAHALEVTSSVRFASRATINTGTINAMVLSVGTTFTGNLILVQGGNGNGYVGIDGTGAWGWNDGSLTINANTANKHVIIGAQGVEIARFTSGKNILVNTTADDGVNKLQVSGSAKFTSDILVNGINIGLGAGNVASNLRFGGSALLSNTTGAGNVALGYAAMYYNTGGSNNMAIGVQALVGNSTGDNNVAVGTAALFGNTNGYNNVAIGHWAAYDSVGSKSNSVGANNIFIGYGCLGESGIESNRTWIGNASTTSTWLGGNLLLGTRTNGTERLQVVGNAKVTGNLFISTTSSSQPIRAHQDTYRNFSVDYPTTPSIYTTQINFGLLGRLQYDGNGGQLYIANTSTQAGSSIYFTSGTTNIARFANTGNFIIQSGAIITDNGQRLQVIGDTLLRGSGATSATTALTVQNSSSTTLMTIRNDGITKFGSSTYFDTSSPLIVGTDGVGAARLSIANNGNYQDALFVNTSVASGNINTWSFGQRRDTFFGNALGSFQIVGGYTSNTGSVSTVGGGYRVPLICNPNGDVLILGANANVVNGLIGLKVNAPTAHVDVTASTTTNASLRIRSGVAPTTPNDGDIWFDGTDIKMRIGGVTKTFTLV